MSKPKGVRAQEQEQLVRVILERVRINCTYILFVHGSNTTMEFAEALTNKLTTKIEPEVRREIRNAML